MFPSPPTSVSWHLTNTRVLHLESRDKEVLCTFSPSAVRGIENGLPSRRRAPFEEEGKPNPEQAERATVSRALEDRVRTAEQSDTVTFSDSLLMTE